MVESYVLGLASEADQQEFEAICQKHPDVLQARLQFEEALERQLLQDAVAAPAALQNRVEESLRLLAAPVVAMQATHKTPVRSMGIWKLLAAASVATLIGVLAWAVTLNQRNQDLQNQNVALRRTAATASDQLAQMQQDKERLQNPALKMAAMQGTANAPGALATVYWDTTSKDVYMLVNNLPTPASGKQYQLWALIDNKPLDLGVFEVRQNRLLVKMNNVQNAQAFAVTLEPKGGSASPTMESLTVLGKL